MRELIHNLQPTIYALIAMGTLLVFPQKLRKEKVHTFYTKPHFRLRIAAPYAVYIVASLVISFLLSTKRFFWINAFFIFVLMSVYYTILLIRMDKVRRSIENS